MSPYKTVKRSMQENEDQLHFELCNHSVISTCSDGSKAHQEYLALLFQL